MSYYSYNASQFHHFALQSNNNHKIWEKITYFEPVKYWNKVKKSYKSSPEKQQQI